MANNPRQNIDAAPADGQNLDVVISAIGAIASLQSAGIAPTATVDLDRSINAVSVLLSALPSNVVASLESELQDLTTSTSAASPTSTSPVTATQTSSASEPSRESSRPSTLISSTTSATNHIKSSTNHAASPTNHPTSSPSPSITSDSSSNSSSHNRAAVAGIASGVVAGAVLVALAAIFLLKYRKNGRVCCFGRKNRPQSKPKTLYPESAWLYDPRATPPDPYKHIRADSSAATLLRICQEDEMAERDRNPDPFASPNRPIRATSPLLQPRRDDQMMEVDRTPDRFTSPTRPPRATSPLLSSASQIRMVAPSPTASPRASEVKGVFRTSMAASIVDDDQGPRR